MRLAKTITVLGKEVKVVKVYNDKTCEVDTTEMYHNGHLCVISAICETEITILLNATEMIKEIYSEPKEQLELIKLEMGELGYEEEIVTNK